MALPLDQDERNRFLERAGSALVLSEKDFERAVAVALDPPRGVSEPPLRVLDQPMLQLAAELAGTANAPGTLGVVADYRGGPAQRFAGEMFLVARDAVFDEVAHRMQCTDYFVAAVGLTGSANWIGRSPSFAIDTAIVGEPGRCCGKNTICVPQGGGGGGGWSPIAITPRTGVTTIQPKAQIVREQSGVPAVTFTVFHPGPDGAGLPDRFLHMCTRVIGDRGCLAKKPVCDHTDIGFTLADSVGDTGSGSTRCGPGTGGTVAGRNVPKICQYIMSPEHLPAKCGGWCESCQTRAPGREAFCAHSLPVPGGGSACDPVPPGQALVDNERRKLEFGWKGPQDAGTRCRPTGRDGIEFCITCDEHGSCQEAARRPQLDPTLADADPAAESDDPEDEWEPYPGDPQTQVTFDPMEILGEVDPPLSAPPLVNAPDDIPGPDSGEPTERPAGGPDRLRPDDLLNPGGGTGNRPPGGGTRPTGNRGGAGIGDPVDLGDGALVLDHADLSFPGPVWPLAFSRRYRSTSAQRGALGSNWTHNWDVRVEPLTGETLPAFLSPWYGGLPPRTTGVLLHDGNAGSQLYALDIATQLFLPQAGGTGTLRETTDGGWALRDPDGRIRVFNADGYLISDRDRCGVGFEVAYEPTPLEELFRHACTPQQLDARNETLTSRRNWLLAYLLGRTGRPDGAPDAWAVTAADFPVKGLDDDDLAERLRYAIAYLVHISHVRAAPQVPDSIDDGRRLRPVTVTDDLGRQLMLEYYRAPQQGTGYDFAGHPEAGLLAGVRGPAGATVAFGYDRPAATRATSTRCS